MRNIALLLLIFVMASCQTATKGNNKETSTSEVVKPTKEQESACKKSVMKVDAGIAAKRNKACKKQSLGKTISEYIYGLEHSDFTHCPESFKSAFYDHIIAWKETLPIAEKYPDLRGEMHALFEQIEAGPDGDAFKPLVAKVWSTWEEVEKVAE